MLMATLTVNTLCESNPPLGVSTHVDFRKTVNYISTYSSLDIGIVKNSCPSSYQASNLLLRKAQLLYRNNDVSWIEAVADFEELHAECLQKDRKNAVGTFTLALDIFKWISEGSDYLQVVYKEDAARKREEIFRRMDDLQVKIETCRCISDKKVESYLVSIQNRLEASGHLWHAEKVIRQLLYLLSYDADILTEALIPVIRLTHELIVHGRIGKNELAELYGLLKKKAQAAEAKTANVWYMDEWAVVHPVITYAVQIHAFVYLVSKEAEISDSGQAVAAARICRYLSRIPSVYSEVLKNKSYTLLTGENKLNGKIRWDCLCDYDERRMLEQLVTIPIEDTACPVFEPVSKWQQYSNASNTLTLDNDGFTLSRFLNSASHSWRGRKDRVSVLNDRLFVALFAKPVCPFTACRTIKDYRLYWKQLAEDFPFSLQENKPVVEMFPAGDLTVKAKMPVEELPGTAYPSPDERVHVRVISVNRESVSMCVEIIDKAYQGMKARLPFAYVNSCYSMIPGFADLFSANMQFQAKVKAVENGEVLLSLVQDFNEFIYPECVRRKTLQGKVIEIREGRVWWLLSSGATATTASTTHKKYRLGDVFKVEYEGLLSRKLKNNIEVKSHVAHPDLAAFDRSVLENLQDFFTFLTKEVYKGGEDPGLSDVQKKENNPFFVALKDLSLDESPAVSSGMEEKPVAIAGKETKDVLEDTSVLTIELVRELIYCVDSLALDLEDSIERFNVYNILHFLCNFAGNQPLARYYRLCADYIYNVEVLMTEPYHDRFSKTNILKFHDLLKNMELMGVNKYGRDLKQYSQVISVMQALYKEDALPLLNAFMRDNNPLVSELARYFSIIRFLREKDTELQEVIYKNINLLLGFKEAEKKKRNYVPVYFGHEGIEKEFKTSAFFHANKNADEDQFVVLARVVASFMNTDGGTLYIGVNDNGYLNGLREDLKLARNDSDVYLRKVNRNIINQLGETVEDRNRYQENIRCRIYEYEDGRLVLAFRAVPINEVVKVKGKVYTRTGSSSLVKAVCNVDEFVRQRRALKLDSAPKKPEFPVFFSEERKEYIFKEQQGVKESQAATAIPVVEKETVPLPAREIKKEEEKGKEKNKSKIHTCKTSCLRTNPLIKKADHGYTPGHLFVSLFANGKIASSPSPKIGVWGDEGKVIFSYNPEDKEDILVAVFSNGEVGLSNLKKGISQPNTPLAFVDSVDGLLFLSPAHKTDYLLLIAEKDGEKRFRIITLDDFEKSMSIQPRNTLVLEPDKGTFVYAEILSDKLVKSLNEDKLSLKEFDQYNAGRRWEHTIYKSDVEVLTSTCGITF